MNWIEEFKKEEAEVEYCPYCLEARGNKASCCYEVHFMPFKDLYEQDQDEIARTEYEFNVKE